MRKPHLANIWRPVVAPERGSMGNWNGDEPRGCNASVKGRPTATLVASTATATATARQRIASTGGSLSDMRHGNCAEQDAGSHLPVLTTASRLRRLPCELRREEF